MTKRRSNRFLRRILPLFPDDFHPVGEAEAGLFLSDCGVEAVGLYYYYYRA